MLAVPPPRLVCSNVNFGDFAEGDGFGCVEPFAGPRGAPRLYRVYSLIALPSGIQRPRAGFCEAVESEGPSPIHRGRRSSM